MRSMRAVLSFVVMMFFGISSPHAMGVDNGTFELDGNAVVDGPAPAEDWELLYDNGNNTGGSSIAFTGILADPGQDTIFTGGRKDIQDISKWRWKSNGGFPDKNDITNAYAAAFLDEMSGDLIVHFGADRFSIRAFVSEDGRQPLATALAGIPHYPARQTVN